MDLFSTFLRSLRVILYLPLFLNRKCEGSLSWTKRFQAVYLNYVESYHIGKKFSKPSRTFRTLAVVVFPPTAIIAISLRVFPIRMTLFWLVIHFLSVRKRIYKQFPQRHRPLHSVYTFSTSWRFSRTRLTNW